MTYQVAVTPRSEAEVNQLASLVDRLNCRDVDGKQCTWYNGPNVSENVVSGEYRYTQRPFKVGQTAVFWLYPTSVHYSQYTTCAFPETLANVPKEDHRTVNQLCVLAQTLF